MLQITKFKTVILILALFVALLLLSACNSQDKPQDSPSSTPKTDSPEVITPPITPLRAEDWHMFMHDLQLSGKSPDQKIKPPLSMLWQFKTGGPITASPVVANGILYIGSADGKLYALNAKEWGIKWVFNAGSAIRYSAAIWGGRVYFSTRDNKFYALNAETGDVLWEFKSKGWMDSPPVVFNRTVYTGAFPTRIYLLDAITGKLKSERQRMVTINGIEYGCTNAEFRPVIPQYNANLWRRYTAGSESFPVTANGFVYIGARNGKIHAIDIASKTEVWSYQIGGPVNAAPAISEGILYAASTDGSIYAFANATESPPIADDTREHGIVTHDNAPVYTEKNGTSPLYRLNDGTDLPILQAAQERYQVELPNKEQVWIDRFAFGQFEDTDGMLFNSNFCGKPRIIHLIDGAEYPYWSPDGERIVMLKRTDLSGSYWKASELWIMDKEGKQARKLYTGQLYNPHVSWSLDGRLIAFEAEEDDDRFVFTADWELGRIEKLVKGAGPAWSPTANQLAFRRRERGYDVIYRINSDGSGGRDIARVLFRQTRRSYTFLHAPSWSSDGNLLAFEVTQNQKLGNGTVTYAAIRIQNIEGERVKQIPTQHQRVRQMRWSSDGARLAYVLSGSNRQDPVLDKRLHIAGITDESLKHRILKHTAPAWSPTGNRLAYLEREDCVGLRWKVWVHDLDSGKKYPIARTSMKLASIVWMPDGKSLCLWHTSDYLRNNVYQPADTKGWIVPINLSP
ncbi:MAG: PQQ-binding-like beta-propeller repeat protein [Candidatus Poribacteria bacterium]|nr:PQQ-binding-like beta-propeller repeat protein [Candidatus Poribacteria bacterium]